MFASAVYANDVFSRIDALNCDCKTTCGSKGPTFQSTPELDQIGISAPAGTLNIWTTVRTVEK